MSQPACLDMTQEENTAVMSDAESDGVDYEYISDSEIFGHDNAACPAPPSGGSLLLHERGALDQEELEKLRARQVMFLSSQDEQAHERLMHHKWSFPDAVVALAMPRSESEDHRGQKFCPVCQDVCQDDGTRETPFAGCGHWICGSCLAPYVLHETRRLLRSTAGASVACPHCTASGACAPGLVGENTVRRILELGGEHALFQRFCEERRKALPHYQALCTSEECRRVVRAPPRVTSCPCRPLCVAGGTYASRWRATNAT